ncbi:MAG TPA: DUF924 family protein [Caulobacteraceae bacterium]
MTEDAKSATDVVAFWRKAGPKLWFAKDDAFDRAIRGGFEGLHLQASRGELADWAETAEGGLALLILLDQFPRNLYRGSAHAFATDPLAYATARRAIERGFDQEVGPEFRPFFYLPFEHSERIEVQDRGIELCEAHKAATGDADTLHWANVHRDIIRRFGRFPHRNKCLGRITTPEEQAFLDDGGFAG